MSPCPGPGPDFKSITSPDFVLVRLRILSIFESVTESGIYQASPGPGLCPGLCPGPDFIHFESWSVSGFYHVRVRVRVRILPTLTLDKHRSKTHSLLGIPVVFKMLAFYRIICNMHCTDVLRIGCLRFVGQAVT